MLFTVDCPCVFQVHTYCVALWHIIIIAFGAWLRSCVISPWQVIVMHHVKCLWSHCLMRSHFLTTVSFFARYRLIQVMEAINSLSEHTNRPKCITHSSLDFISSNKCDASVNLEVNRSARKANPQFVFCYYNFFFAIINFFCLLITTAKKLSLQLFSLMCMNFQSL